MPPAPLTSRLGNLAGKHRRLLEPVVVVRLEVDRILVEIVEQVLRDLGEARLGIALCRRRVAVDRAEIALPVDQRQTHGEVLRHAHESVVDGEIAVRVEVAHRVAHDLRRLHVLLVEVEPEPLHRVEDAPVHGLQSVAHVRQSARHDHAHGVIEIRPLHLVDERDRSDVRRSWALDVCLIVVGQERRKPALECQRTRKCQRRRERKPPALRGEGDCCRTLLYS